MRGAILEYNQTVQPALRSVTQITRLYTNLEQKIKYFWRNRDIFLIFYFSINFQNFAPPPQFTGSTHQTL
jgi:hypothetical protein